MYRAPMVQSTAKAGACEDRVWHAGNKDMASENSTWGPRGGRRVPLPGPGRRSRRAASLVGARSPLGLALRQPARRRRRAERRAEQEPAYPERQNDQRHSNGPHAAGQSGLAGWYAAGAEQSARRIEPCCTPPSRCSQGPPLGPALGHGGRNSERATPRPRPRAVGGPRCGPTGPMQAGRSSAPRTTPHLRSAGSSALAPRDCPATRHSQRLALTVRSSECAATWPRGAGVRRCAAALGEAVFLRTD